VIFPLTRRECSELVCNRRTNRGAAGQGDRGDKEDDVGGQNRISQHEEAG
jgi:hypothetical protein